MKCPLDNQTEFDYNDCQDCEHCASCYIKARNENPNLKFSRRDDPDGDNFPKLQLPYELNDHKRKNPNKITQVELDDFILDLFRLNSFSEWEEKCKI